MPEYSINKELKLSVANQSEEINDPVLVLDAEGKVKQVPRSEFSGGGGITFITKSKQEIDQLISVNGLKPGTMYEITGCHASLYDDGTIGSTGVVTMMADFINNGTGYVDGFYKDVRIDGGSGTGLFGDVTVVDGSVDGIEIIRQTSKNYTVNDILTIDNSFLGGTGSGFQDNIANKYLGTRGKGTTIYLQALTNNTLSKIGHGQFWNPKYDKQISGYGIWNNIGSFDYEQIPVYAEVISEFALLNNSQYGGVTDSNGNLFITQVSNNRVIKITPDGVQSIFGATGNFPRGIAIDSNDIIYVLNDDSFLTKILPDGTSSNFGMSEVSQHHSIVIDSNNNIFTTSRSTNVISKFTPDGTRINFSTYESSTYHAYSVTNICIDSNDVLYVANGNINSISKIMPDGTSTILATLSANPDVIAVDSEFNLYVADTHGITGVILYKITPDGTVTNFGVLVGTFVKQLLVVNNELFVAFHGSNNINKFSLIDGSRTITNNAEFSGQGEIFHFNEIVYLLSGASSKIHKINKQLVEFINDEEIVSNNGATGTLVKSISTSKFINQSGNWLNSTSITGVASGGKANISNIDVMNLNPSKYGQAILLGNTGDSPQDICMDSIGNIYTINQSAGNNGISKITPDGITTTILTTGLNAPNKVCIDNDDNLYAIGYYSNIVSKVTPDGTSSIFGTTGSDPKSICIDNVGNIYVANSGSNNVTKITPDGTSTILGTTGNYPSGMCIDNIGNIYTCNSVDHNVTKITPDGTSIVVGIVDTQPMDICIDSIGNIYIVSVSSNVTKITPDGISTIIGYISVTPSSMCIDYTGNLYITAGYDAKVMKIPAILETIYGGYSWENINGNIGTNSDILNLDSEEWIKKPWDLDHYNKVFDIIEYDFDNDWIYRRSESKSGNTVTYTKADHTWFGNEYSAISVFMFGNEYSYEEDRGILNNILNHAYNENINFRGDYLIDLIFNPHSYQMNMTFCINSSQNGITFNRTSHQENIFFSEGSRQSDMILETDAGQQELFFGKNSYQERLTIGLRSGQSNIVFSEGSWQEKLNFDPHSAQYDIKFGVNSHQDTIFFNTGSSQQNTIFKQDSYQQNITFGVNSYQDQITFKDGSFQENIYFGSGSYQDQIKFGFDSRQINSIFEMNSRQSAITFETNSYQDGITFETNSYVGAITIPENTYHKNITYKKGSYVSVLELSNNIENIEFESSTNIQNIDLTTAVIFYGIMFKTVYNRPDGLQRLKYFNNHDNLVIADIAD